MARVLLLLPTETYSLIIGDLGDNVLDGGGGNDELIGGPGTTSSTEARATIS